MNDRLARIRKRRRLFYHAISICVRLRLVRPAHRPIVSFSSTTPAPGRKRAPSCRHGARGPLRVVGASATEPLGRIARWPVDAGPEGTDRDHSYDHGTPGHTRRNRGVDPQEPKAMKAIADWRRDLAFLCHAEIGTERCRIFACARPLKGINTGRIDSRLQDLSLGRAGDLGR